MEYVSQGVFLAAAVLDTHAAVWYLLKSRSLSPKALHAIEVALQSGEPVFLPSISLVEVVYLVEIGTSPEAHSLGFARAAWPTSELPIADCRLTRKDRNSKIETGKSKLEIQVPTGEFRISVFDFRFWAIVNRQSLVPQRHHGIDLRCPPGGNENRDYGDRRQQDRYRHESRGVIGVNFVKQIAHEASNCQCGY